MKTHRKLDSVLLKTVSYVGVIFRLDEAKHQLIYNAVLAFAIAPLTKSNAYLQSMQFGGDAEYLQKIAGSLQSASGSVFSMTV